MCVKKGREKDTTTWLKYNKEQMFQIKQFYRLKNNDIKITTRKIQLTDRNKKIHKQIW
jgi:hypothetical protein